MTTHTLTEGLRDGEPYYDICPNGHHIARYVEALNTNGGAAMPYKCEEEPEIIRYGGCRVVKTVGRSGGYAEEDEARMAYYARPGRDRAATKLPKGYSSPLDCDD